MRALRGVVGPKGKWEGASERGGWRAGSRGLRAGSARGGERRASGAGGETRGTGAGEGKPGGLRAAAALGEARRLPPAARRALWTGSPHDPAASREEAAPAAAGTRALGLPHLRRGTREAGCWAGRPRRRSADPAPRIAAQPPGSASDPRWAPAPWRPGSESQSMDFRKMR